MLQPGIGRIFSLAVAADLSLSPDSCRGGRVGSPQSRADIVARVGEGRLGRNNRTGRRKSFRRFDSARPLPNLARARPEIRAKTCPISRECFHTLQFCVDLSDRVTSDTLLMSARAASMSPGSRCPADAGLDNGRRDDPPKVYRRNIVPTVGPVRDFSSPHFGPRSVSLGSRTST
jgi:hypothetical protein